MTERPISTAAEIRETFATRPGILAAMMGAAVGLGNVWRLPYMVGRFGGTAFLAVYLVAVLALGIPAMMAEWTLGRTTRRGPVGAYEVAGLPGGRWVGWAPGRGETLRQLGSGRGGEGPDLVVRLLRAWIRWVIPAGFLALTGWWVARDVLGLVGGP